MSLGLTVPPLTSVTVLVEVVTFGMASTVKVVDETEAGLLPPSLAAATSTLLDKD